MYRFVLILQVLSMLVATVIIALSILLVIGVITPSDFCSYKVRESYSDYQEW
ncbi:MAG: hypothetical protein ABIC68_08215 [Candidatus Omnitrophota bacterium]